MPPFFPSREERRPCCYGRGACDAKGILAAQIAAAERLRAAGERRVGLLFVAGEERGSDGARAANTLARRIEFLINGEPTDNRLGTATRGVYRVRLRADRPRRALEPARARRVGHRQAARRAGARCGRSSGRTIRVLGRTFYTVGLIDGGVAPNVISPDAEAELMFRTVGRQTTLRQLLDRAARPSRVDRGSARVPPVRLTTVPGIDTAVFPFTTDIPLLDRWGAPLLFGPGSILVAHTADEYCEVSNSCAPLTCTWT